MFLPFYFKRSFSEIVYSYPRGVPPPLMWNAWQSGRAF